MIVHFSAYGAVLVSTGAGGYRLQSGDYVNDQKPIKWQL